MKNRKFKKIIILGGLSSLLLTSAGCTFQPDKKTAETTEIVKTEAPTTEVLTTETITEEDIENEKIEAIAEESLNKYSNYYNGTNDFEQKNFTKEDIVNAILLVNGKFDSLNSDQVINAYTLLEDITCPFDLLEELNTCDLLEINNLDYNVTEHTNVEEYPRVSDFILDENDSTKNIMIEIEDMKNNLAKDLKSDQKLTMEEKTEFNKKLVDMFQGVIAADKSAESDQNTLGKELAMAYSKYGILKLGAAANKESVWIENPDKIDIGNGLTEQIKVNFTEAERIIVSKYESLRYFNALVEEGKSKEEAVELLSTNYGLELADANKIAELDEIEGAELAAKYYEAINKMPVYFYDPCDEQARITELYKSKKTLEK